MLVKVTSIAAYLALARLLKGILFGHIEPARSYRSWLGSLRDPVLKCKLTATFFLFFYILQYEQAFAAKRLQNWEIPKRFKEVSFVFCFIKCGCVHCAITLDARFGQSEGIAKGNGCEARHTSKEQTNILRFLLEVSRPCLHPTHVG